MPQVLGHEVAGVVDDVGLRVDATWIGRRVVIDPVIGCGMCRFCRTGRKLLCRQGGELGTTGGDGGYAEYVTIPAANLYHLPSSISFEAGALMEPLNCTLGAFLKARVQPGESVVILGSGPAGLLFCQLARAAGGGNVHIVGRGTVRLDLARRFGATETWTYRDNDLEEKVRAAHRNAGPDVVIDASGADVAVRQALDWVEPGGRIVLYGISGSNQPNIRSDAIIEKELTVVTGIGAPLLWVQTIRAVESARIDLQAMVTARFALDQAEAALELARDGDRAAKVVLCP
jgi:threonine dehydrogenase-like Zn-dependent dehydrogenase